MLTKVCKTCNETKDISEFPKCSSYKDKVRNSCKCCEYAKYKKWKEKNSEKVSEWSYENSEKIKMYKKNNYNKNRDKYLLQKKEYYIINREDILIKMREYENNKSDERKIEDKIKYNNWQNNKYKNDILFYMKRNISSYISACIRKNGYTKKSKTCQIIGCSFEELKIYLESKFEPWMTWENRGLYNGELKYGWDIDHIIPLSSAKNEEELLNLFFYTNLQPLCSKVNRDIKKCKIHE